MDVPAGGWFDTKFAGEKVPTIEEVLKLVAEYRQHDVLIAVYLKAEKVGEDVVRWVYVRFLPTESQIEAVHRAAKKSFIAGPTVGGNVPKNWEGFGPISLVE